MGTGSVVWAITTYYNPVRYGRRLSNYKIFRDNLAIPLVSIELSFDGKFDLTEGDADILIQVCGGALVWQKERLLNLALKAVPADVEHVAWLDCDVILKKNDWALEAKKHLQDQNVVQLFSEAVFIDSHDYTQRSERNGSAYVPGLLKSVWCQRPHFSWKHDREESGQIYARFCLGGETKSFYNTRFLRWGDCWKRRQPDGRCDAGSA